jgi:hypothetical protein
MMNVRNLRAAAAAFVIGGAVFGATAVSAQTTVSSAVGRPLQEARQLADSGKYREAMSRLDAAAAAAKNPAENRVVDQMKQYIAVKSGDASIGGALGAKAKFAADAGAGRWKDVIAGGEALKKTGALDAQSMLVVAQAYYKISDPKGCMSYIRNNLGAGGGGEAGLQLLQRCAYDAHDEAAERSALEQLVARTGKSEYWASLLKLAERSRGLKDQNTLDMYRLKAMTGNLKTADDVMTYAQIALVRRVPAEAIAVVNKGVADKILPPGDRINRLLTMANGRNTEANAAAAKGRAAANGDQLIEIGQQEIASGKAKDAIATIQAGIAKKPTSPTDAQLRLGTAYLAAGQKADAVKAFNAVKGNPADELIAKLYATYARQ